LENILGQLRQAGLVESVRGKEGGYFLSRAPDQLSVGEVIRIVQGPVAAVDCLESTQDCALKAGCVLLPMWRRAHEAMMGVYDGTTFGELAEQERASRGCEILDYAI
jgi:Rrf2 family protein